MAPERQQQNPVERTIQTFKNLCAANMFDQNLLGVSFGAGVVLLPQKV